MKSRLDKVLFKLLGRVLSYIFTISLLLLGAVGLISAYINPFTYALPYVNNCYSYLGVTGCGAETSLIQLDLIILV